MPLTVLQGRHQKCNLQSQTERMREASRQSAYTKPWPGGGVDKHARIWYISGGEGLAVDTDPTTAQQWAPTAPKRIPGVGMRLNT